MKCTNCGIEDAEVGLVVSSEHRSYGDCFRYLRAKLAEAEKRATDAEEKAALYRDLMNRGHQELQAERERADSLAMALRHLIKHEDCDCGSVLAILDAYDAARAGE